MSSGTSLMLDFLLFSQAPPSTQRGSVRQPDWRDYKSTSKAIKAKVWGEISSLSDQFAIKQHGGGDRI